MTIENLYISLFFLIYSISPNHGSDICVILPQIREIRDKKNPRRLAGILNVIWSSALFLAAGFCFFVLGGFDLFCFFVFVSFYISVPGVSVQYLAGNS